MDKGALPFTAFKTGIERLLTATVYRQEPARRLRVLGELPSDCGPVVRWHPIAFRDGRRGRRIADHLPDATLRACFTGPRGSADCYSCHVFNSLPDDIDFTCGCG